MTDLIKATTANGVLNLVLNRPDKKNALTDGMYGELADALTVAQSDRQVRVVLIRGEGEAFCAGNDIAEFAAIARSGATPEGAFRFIQALVDCAKPVVAAVQGAAVGIGTTLLLHCDYVVLAEGARLTAPFVKLGLVPEAAASLLLPARIGHQRAFAMFALGEVIEADTALALGLANAVVPQTLLRENAESCASRLSRQPLPALIATKKLMRPRDTIAAQVRLEIDEFVQRLRSPEAREAFTAFAERRLPDFEQFK